MWIRGYNEANNTWGSFITSPTASIETGKGYSLWTYDEFVIPTFQGKINHGDIALSVQFTNSGQSASQMGWNLVGNPFPSAIDWRPSDATKWLRTNIAPTIYLFSAASGNYLTYNPNLPGSNGRFIAMGQGFFVQATGPNPSLTIRKGAQLHHEVYFRRDEVAEDVIKISVDGNGYMDECFIIYREDAANGFDFNYDAVKFDGLPAAPQLYTKKQDGADLIKLAVNSINDIQQLQGKLVYLQVGADTEYTLNFEHHIVQDFSPVIRDRFADVIVLPETDYVFTAIPTDNTERFEIVDQSTLSTRIFNKDELLVWQYNNILYIDNLQKEQLRQIVIYDILGTEVLYSVSSKTDLNALSRGVYLVRVLTDKQTVVRKISVQ